VWRSRRQAGFTVPELILVIVLVVLLVAVAVERLLPLTGEAERVALEENRHRMEAALRLQVAEQIVKSGPEAVRALASANPVTLMKRPPGGYLGEMPGVDPADIRGGEWYYDPASRELVYRVRHARYFRTELPGPPRVRFRVERDGDGRYHGLRLASPDAYYWETDGSELMLWLTRQ
jgi:prepilin-type N-terminal cleavage/methylation domain-containing protein